MTVLRIDGLRHGIGDGELEVDRVEVASGCRLIVFGPNGAGKTTLLRLLAGTLPGGPSIPAAYLPQRPYFFRGTARHNLELGLDDTGRSRAGRIAERFGVDRLLARPAGTLSGGERQRIALARVLARPDPVLLLDEPLNALDARDRQTMAGLINAEMAGRTAVIVTHDRDEAVALGDDLLVLIDGRVRQVGPVAEVIRLPADDDVAEVVGVANAVSGVATGTEGGLTSVVRGELIVWGIGEVDEGCDATAMFGAETVTVYPGRAADAGSARNSWAGRVVDVRPRGWLVEVIVDVGERIAALVTPGSLEALGLATGSPVTLVVKAAVVRVVAR